MISYAQNFEDVMLARALGDRGTGFYVDIGACHPDTASVTRHFYELGWRGVNVEPMPAPFAELRAARTRDVNVPAAIASYDGELAMYEGPTVGESSALRPFDTAPPTVVPCMTLATLCRTHVTQPIDFLKVDVEGLERDVIAGGDWEAFRPTIVVVEITAPWSTRRRDDAPEIVRLMHASRYDEVYFDGLNAFFVARESASLAARFAAPPNVLDRFVLASEAERAAASVQLQARIDATEKRLAEVREHSEHVTQRLVEVQAYSAASEQAVRLHAAREASLQSEIAASASILEATRLRAEQSRQLLQRRLARALQGSQVHIAQLKAKSDARVARVLRASKRSVARLADAAGVGRAAAELAAARAQLAEAQLSTLQSQLRASESASAQAMAEFRHAASVAGQAHAQVAELRSAVRAADERQREALQRALQAEHTLRSMLVSRSWRLTAPLRTLGKLFRRTNDQRQPRGAPLQGSLRASALRRGRLLAKRTRLYHWLAPRLKARYPSLWARARSVVIDNPARLSGRDPTPAPGMDSVLEVLSASANEIDSVDGIAARIRDDIARRRG